MVTADVELAWKTQAGYRHHVEGLENEDAVFASNEHPLFDAVLIVSDGMGGHPLPKEASATAVATAQRTLFQERHAIPNGEIPRLVMSALQAAHHSVVGLRPHVPAHYGHHGKYPGATLSIAVIANGTLTVAHAGDGTAFLMRDGQLHVIAGGEEQRQGNRPAQYLGQDGPLDAELKQLRVTVADRVLLCTDGLTRYFRDAGPEALERVLGRRGIPMSTLASQLLAHSRPDEYDDDTTVALAEVTSLAEGHELPSRRVPPSTQPKRQEEVHGMRSGNHSPTASRAGLALVIASSLLAGAGLLTLGFAAGLTFAQQRSTADSSTSASDPSLSQSTVASDPAALQNLPAGNLVLLDSLGNRVFHLTTQNGSPGVEPVSLQAFRVGRDGRFERAGKFQFDPARGMLADAQGRSIPVQMDPNTGSLRVVRTGTLVVNTQPTGAHVIVNGRTAGKSPARITLPAGLHRVRVSGSGWTSSSEVEVPPERTVTVTLEPK